MSARVQSKRYWYTTVVCDESKRTTIYRRVQGIRWGTGIDDIIEKLWWTICTPPKIIINVITIRDAHPANIEDGTGTILYQGPAIFEGMDKLPPVKRPAGMLPQSTHTPSNIKDDELQISEINTFCTQKHKRYTVFPTLTNPEGRLK